MSITTANIIYNNLLYWSNFLTTSLSEEIYLRERSVVAASDTTENKHYLWLVPARVIVNMGECFVALGCALVQIAAFGAMRGYDELKKRTANYTEEYRTYSDRCYSLAKDYVKVVLPIILGRIFSPIPLLTVHDYERGEEGAPDTVVYAEGEKHPTAYLLNRSPRPNAEAAADK